MRKLGGCLRYVRFPLSMSLSRFDITRIRSSSFESIPSFNFDDEESRFGTVLIRKSTSSLFPLPSHRFDDLRFILNKCGNVEADASPRERYSRFGNLYRTRQEEDR